MFFFFVCLFLFFYFIFLFFPTIVYYITVNTEKKNHNFTDSWIIFNLKFTKIDSLLFRFDLCPWTTSNSLHTPSRLPVCVSVCTSVITSHLSKYRIGAKYKVWQKISNFLWYLVLPCHLHRLAFCTRMQYAFTSVKPRYWGYCPVSSKNYPSICTILFKMNTISIMPEPFFTKNQRRADTTG